MTFDDIRANLADQERGRWLDVLDPWEGKPVGIRLLIAGPDSDTQRKTRIAMMDELAEVALPDGTVSGESRERARINSLARCVLNMETVEGLPFSHKSVVRILNVGWIQAQADAFAADRSKFRSEG